INTRARIALRQWQNLILDAETGIPFAAGTLESDRFDATSKRAVQLHLDMPHALHVEMVCGQPASISPTRERIAIEASPRLEARIASLLARFDATKERLKGLLDTTQNVLAGREIRQSAIPLLPDRLQLVRLIVVVQRHATPLIGIPTLLQGRIIQTTGFPELGVKRVSLGIRREETVSVGLAHLVSPLLVLDVAPAG